MSNLESFLSPRSIAVIGASRDRKKPGNLILRNIVEGGFAGDVYPVNPAGGEIEGLQTYGTVEEIPAEVDMAVIVVARAHVEKAMHQCVGAGVRSAVVVTAGFGEGDEMGRETQQRLRELAQGAGMVAIGPNTIGYVNAEARLFASFVRFPEWRNGSVALVAQTGIYAGAVVHELMARPFQKLGIKVSVDVGNRIALSDHDLIEPLVSDDDIKVLGFYIEEFDEGDTFLAKAAQAKQDKPIIVLKSGRTGQGARASMAHTGSRTGDEEANDRMLREHGLVRAEDNAEFVSFLTTFAYCPVPAGRRVGVVTFSGALGIMATDALVDAGMEIADFAQSTLDALDELAPDWQAIGNPADLWSAAEADPAKAAQRLYHAVLEDPNVDQMLFVLLALPNVDHDGMREVFEDLRHRRPEVPIHVTLDGALRGAWAARLEGLGIVVHDSVRTAARAMNALSTYAEYREAAQGLAG
ncbi:CoA-binding protein [Nocardioides sp. LHD-245]|uniref:CoA-binding protein n=1 Tax=Nocardioides sp. LHD-245 TaxID=3051387 RepID=UPI0027DED0BE|nr:CoA-binding protein [Nocardioides sp. LHD-245]